MYRSSDDATLIGVGVPTGNPVRNWLNVSTHSDASVIRFPSGILYPEIVVAACSQRSAASRTQFKSSATLSFAENKFMAHQVNAIATTRTTAKLPKPMR